MVLPVSDRAAERPHPLGDSRGHRRGSNGVQAGACSRSYCCDHPGCGSGICARRMNRRHSVGREIAGVGRKREVEHARGHDHRVVGEGYAEVVRSRRSAARRGIAGRPHRKAARREQRVCWGHARSDTARSPGCRARSGTRRDFPSGKRAAIDAPQSRTSPAELSSRWWGVGLRYRAPAPQRRRR